MKTYYVRVPLTGYVGIAVESDSEKKAIDKAMKLVENAELAIPEEIRSQVDELIISFCEKVVQGNVFYGELSEVDVEEIDDGEDDDENSNNGNSNNDE